MYHFDLQFFTIYIQINTKYLNICVLCRQQNLYKILVSFFDLLFSSPVFLYVFSVLFQPINDSLNTIEYSLGHQNVNSQANSPEPDMETEENILQSDELGSVHSLYSKVLVEEQPKQQHYPSIDKSMDNSTLRDNIDTPQSIPLADLDGELMLSTQSISSLKSSQSIKSYCSSIKVCIVQWWQWYNALQQ